MVSLSSKSKLTDYIVSVNSSLEEAAKLQKSTSVKPQSVQRSATLPARTTNSNPNQVRNQLYYLIK